MGVAGDGAVAIGSGPSLRAIDVGQLRLVPTIAYNRSYVAWDRWGFTPTYYACFDPVVAEDNATALAAVCRASTATRFFIHRVARQFGLPDLPNVTWVTPTEGTELSDDLQAPTDFGNVGASSMQTLLALGFTRVLLVGMDAHHSAWRESGAQLDGSGYVWGTRNPNYFDDRYVAGARQVFEPNNHRLFSRWSDVVDGGRRRGLSLRLASPGSALSCVEAIDFEAGLNWVQGPAGQAEIV